MVMLRAYAVVCANGEIHQNDENCFVFLDKEQARDEMSGSGWSDTYAVDEDGCGPHKFVTLRGEVSLARRRAK